MTGHYEIHGAGDKWKWRLVNGGGKTLAESTETFPTAAAAKDDVHLAKQDARDADTAAPEVHEVRARK